MAAAAGLHLWRVYVLSISSAAATMATAAGLHLWCVYVLSISSAAMLQAARAISQTEI